MKVIHGTTILSLVLTFQMEPSLPDSGPASCRLLPVDNLIAIFLTVFVVTSPAHNLITIFLTKLANFLTEPAASLARFAKRLPAHNLIAIFLNKCMKRLPIGSPVIHIKDNIIAPTVANGDT
ncbi:MAG: hypothetical protein ACNYPI_05560 [Arenicellales bacterium WSBS_2016_MAG_OTU3]